MVPSLVRPHHPLPSSRKVGIMKRLLGVLTLSLLWLPGALGQEKGETKPGVRKTVVSIHGDAFHINGQPTYAGRTWQGKRIEGLLLNSRMVQGIFDDLNPMTR